MSDTAKPIPSKSDMLYAAPSSETEPRGSMLVTRTWIVLGIAALVGIAAWECVVPSGSKREAWDLPIYWQAAYPGMLAASALLGALAPERPWRWGLAVCLGQGLWVLLKATVASGLPNLFPLGLIAFAVLGLPCMAAAHAGAWLSRRVA